MTPRENLLHLLRKEGYEEVPVDFSLCPSQEESYRNNEHSSSDYRDYFQMPWKRLPVLQPDEDFREQYQKYHQEVGLTMEEIDEWVGRMNNIRSRAVEIVNAELIYS